jgi:hypothetical protein
MAIQPVPDQSDEFKKSGMVLITDPKSDYYLNKSEKQKKYEMTHEEMLDEAQRREKGAK